jgi:hypothetical protein
MSTFGFTALLVIVTLGACACGTAPVLNRLIDARREAAALRAAFLEASDAASRAVLWKTDADSADAAREAETATRTAEGSLARLEPLLQSLGYKTEIASVERFKTLFAEYRQLDKELLGLAVENTNVKAQQLSFGPGRRAADEFSAALARAAGANPSADLEANILAARSAVLEIEVLQARHIAEADPDVMTQMEQQMTKDVNEARARLGRMKRTTGAGTVLAAALDEAASALDRFEDVNRQLIALSRQNTDVRSLDLMLGRKRVVTAACRDELRLLESELAGHGSEASR